MQPDVQLQNHLSESNVKQYVWIVATSLIPNVNAQIRSVCEQQGFPIDRHTGRVDF